MRRAGETPALLYDRAWLAPPLLVGFMAAMAMRLLLLLLALGGFFTLLQLHGAVLGAPAERNAERHFAGRERNIRVDFGYDIDHRFGRGPGSRRRRGSGG